MSFHYITLFGARHESPCSITGDNGGGTDRLAYACPAGHQTQPKVKSVGTPAKMTSADLNKAMRKLWEDHITNTRNYIISALADLPDSDAVSKRLLKNQDDIGDAIKPYYGEEAGKKLAMLAARPHSHCD